MELGVGGHEKRLNAASEASGAPYATRATRECRPHPLPRAAPPRAPGTGEWRVLLECVLARHNAQERDEAKDGARLQAGGDEKGDVEAVLLEVRGSVGDEVAADEGRPDHEKRLSDSRAFHLARCFLET